ncbi:mechanosensitive ion channel family protein, partial [Pseudomonas syringae pv. tagetis]
IRELPIKVEAIINAQELARFERSHFRGVGETSLEFETVFIVLDHSYNVYMDVEQSINLKIMVAFAELDVRFAFPSRTVYVA